MFYIWSFSADTIETATSGVDLNTYKFTGNEQLQINFSGTLASNVQVDVYAHMASLVEVSTNSVKKISLV